jgi:hypothetical protein
MSLSITVKKPTLLKKTPRKVAKKAVKKVAKRRRNK